MPKITFVMLIKQEELDRELQPFHGSKRMAEQELKQLILRNVGDIVHPEDIEIHIED